MDFLLVFLSIIYLFLIIGTGFVLRKYGVLNGNRVRWISHILVNIALPALTISSMQVPLSDATIGIAESMLLIAVAYYLAAFCLSFVICRFLPTSGSEKGVFQFMLVFPNVGFMGIPVAMAVLGPDSLFYVILFCLPFNFFAFSLGVYLIAHGRPGKFNPLVLLTPGLVASFIGLALFLTGYTIPAPVSTALDWIGLTMTPLAMLVVGALLATLPVSRLAGDWRIALVTAFRLVLLPVLAFLILLPFVHDKLLLGVAVVLIAMPVAANAVLFSEEYKVDATLASQGVFISTLFCLVTIPVIGFLLL
ncbi:AEC family transporter [Methanoregula sp.]|uniref:AEC family transporter n=1 Tax=Methanoregula sp. TaxID=2052170 RepID=UPI0035642977